MKLLPCLVLIIALFASPILHAKMVSGINVPGSIVVNQQSLVLNGVGIRSKFFMDLYIGSLYLVSIQSELEKVLEQPVAVIRLDITSGMITSDKMADAIKDGFDEVTDGDSVYLQAEIDQFMALFNDEIMDGDQFTFVLTRGKGVASFKNDQPQGEIPGELFRQALIKIWLGDKPAQKSLKQDMLGQ
ncbi:chalcone isomerase family protein [Shewanella sp. OMA3-2]|uniref:chalcone isomerase family protein n=1 Tax=Shewanella sp. OMA3-2 TaxID=2908650 RepID=UPI001F2F6342|nr:chalcone isomerase family protein [Shewanella sp. OMA3-2]UJF21325.1 chalcone isomerase family protein [Shewanella sp. OMA3-2]